jgi:hypothetical protein
MMTRREKKPGSVERDASSHHVLTIISGVHLRVEILSGKPEQQWALQKSEKFNSIHTFFLQGKIFVNVIWAFKHAQVSPAAEACHRSCTNGSALEYITHCLNRRHTPEKVHPALVVEDVPCRRTVCDA